MDNSETAMVNGGSKQRDGRKLEEKIQLVASMVYGVDGTTERWLVYLCCFAKGEVGLRVA